MYLLKVICVIFFLWNKFLYSFQRKCSAQQKEVKVREEFFSFKCHENILLLADSDSFSFIIFDVISFIFFCTRTLTYFLMHIRFRDWFYNWPTIFIYIVYARTTKDLKKCMCVLPIFSLISFFRCSQSMPIWETPTASSSSKNFKNWNS